MNYYIAFEIKMYYNNSNKMDAKSHSTTEEVTSESEKLFEPKPGQHRFSKKDRETLQKVPYSLRISMNQQKAYELTAYYQGMELGEWMRYILDLNSIRPGQIPTPLSTTNNEN